MKRPGARLHRARAAPPSKKTVRSPVRISHRPVGLRRVRLLRHSFALIEPHSGIAGLVFYRNLFNLDPSLRPLFQTSIELQSRKLMESLSYTIALLETPKTLTPVLEALGRRHLSYGAKPEHYDTVIEALLQTFAEVLASAYSTNVRAAWKVALSSVSETMKRGAAETVSLRKPH